MIKVVSVYLISDQKTKEGNTVNYNDVNKVLWELQKQTREIKNKTAQLCWEWLGFSSEYAKQNGAYPKDKEVLSYTLSGFIYDKFKTGYDLYSSNISSTSREVCSKFSNQKKELLRGDISVFSFKSDQPLDLYNKAISLSWDDKDFYVSLKLLNKNGKAKYAITEDFRFKMIVRDKSTRTILERCADGEYKISGSKLVYDRKKRMWCLKLTYNFEAQICQSLDKDKILGINLGIVHPIYASVYGDFKRFAIKGGEIEEFRKRVESRKVQLLEQGKYCGDGRIGHGRKTRTRPAYKVEDKIAQFRNTTNHKYARALVEFAVKNNCGIIQMEDLTGITADADRFLKNWSYYDLQTKIENKAKEYGIEVVYIEPQYTSQRCSRCGCIHAENRPEQAVFRCKECDFSANADYNASQNIAIPQIDKIIAETMSANKK